MRRLRDDIGAISLLHQAIKMNQTSSSRRTSNHSTSMESIKSMDSSYSMASSTTTENVQFGLEDFFAESRDRYFRFNRSIARAQSLYRAKHNRMFALYYRQKKSVRKIEKFFKAKYISLLLWKRIVLHHCILLQTTVRRFIKQIQYKRIKRSIILLQSLYRGFVQHVRYLAYKRRVIILQSIIRGHVIRTQQLTYRQCKLKERRLQVLFLWCLERTALHYRSVFWLQINEPTCLHLAFYKEELLRLYSSLGCARQDSPCFIDDYDRLDFEARFTAVQGLPIINKIAVISAMGMTLKEMATKLDVLIAEMFHGTMKFNALRMKETEDRQRIYDTMKEQQRPDTHYDSLFRLLHIEQRKRRKRKLAHYVWVQCTEEQANISAEIVLSVVEGVEGKRGGNLMNKDWLQVRIRDRVHRHCIETVHACLVSLSQSRSDAASLAASSKRISYGRNSYGGSLTSSGILMADHNHLHHHRLVHLRPEAVGE